MKSSRFIFSILAGCSAFFVTTTGEAGIPLWTFIPDADFPPALTVSASGTATVKYTVINNSTKAHTLVIKPTNGLSQAAACTLAPKGSCELSLLVNGSTLPANGISEGPVLCQTNADGSPNGLQCYQPSQANILRINRTPGTALLNASVTNLALSVSGLTLDGLPSGQARIITITNSGDGPATGLALNYPLWPAGTSASSNCGSSLAAGASCTITVTPGSQATSLCTAGLTPTPGLVSVTASDGASAETDVLILGYGCIYQGGFIYAMTETPDLASSIGGKIAAENDSTSNTGIIWDSSSGCTTIPYNNCYVTNADSGSNGINLAGGNTAIIYDVLTTTNGLTASTYAAGLCTVPLSGYNDWYLPAICELGYGANFGGINCGTAMAPAMQNMQSNLVDNGDIGGLTAGLNVVYPNYYWSSTEYSPNPTEAAWDQIFGTGGTSVQGFGPKGPSTLAVRCSRIFMP